VAGVDKNCQAGFGRTRYSGQCCDYHKKGSLGLKSIKGILKYLSTSLADVGGRSSATISENTFSRMLLFSGQTLLGLVGSSILELPYKPVSSVPVTVL